MIRFNILSLFECQSGRLNYSRVNLIFEASGQGAREQFIFECQLGSMNCSPVTLIFQANSQDELEAFEHGKFLQNEAQAHPELQLRPSQRGQSATRQHR